MRSSALLSRLEIIRCAVAELARKPVIEVVATSRLADLGVRCQRDRTELAVVLERRLGAAVRDDQISTAATVGDLERQLARTG